MEYRKKIATYWIILAVLVVAAILGIFFNSQSLTSRDSQQPLLPGFQPAEAFDVTVDNGTLDGKLEIDRQSGAWSVHFGSKVFPANLDRLTAFVNGLPKMTRFRKVADVDPNSSSALATYGLDKPKALQVKDKSGRVLVDLQTGKTDDTGRYTYVRLIGKPEVWMTERDQLASLELGWSSWTDLSLLPGKWKPDDFVRVGFTGKIVTHDKKTYGGFELDKVVKDKKPQWKLLADGTFPSNAQSYMDGLSDFNVNAFLKDGEVYDPSKDTQGVLTVETQNGGKFEIHIGTELKDGRVPASEGDRRFWLSTWSLEQILFTEQK